MAATPSQWTPPWTSAVAVPCGRQASCPLSTLPVNGTLARQEVCTLGKTAALARGASPRPRPAGHTPHHPRHPWLSCCVLALQLAPTPCVWQGGVLGVTPSQAHQCPCSPPTIGACPPPWKWMCRAATRRPPAATPPSPSPCTACSTALTWARRWLLRGSPWPALSDCGDKAAAVVVVVVGGPRCEAASPWTRQAPCCGGGQRHRRHPIPARHELQHPLRHWAMPW